MTHTLLIVPGLGDSPKGHWQNHWLEHFPHAQKVIQKNWNNPQLNDWINNLNHAIINTEGPIIIVAHSLAAVLIAHWCDKNYNPKVAGALLVAPADVDSKEHTPPETWNFAPIPLISFPFPSVLVTSDNDPYIDSNRAQFLAEKWQSRYYNIGNKGHLNAASELGLWHEGQQLLNDLILSIEQKEN